MAVAETCSVSCLSSLCSVLSSCSHDLSTLYFDLSLSLFSQLSRASDVARHFSLRPRWSFTVPLLFHKPSTSDSLPRVAGVSRPITIKHTPDILHCPRSLNTKLSTAGMRYKFLTLKWTTTQVSCKRVRLPRRGATASRQGSQ
jgi:hypothetical protein